MFTQIDFTEAAGKTIRAVVGDGHDGLLVSFTDNTFSRLSPNQDYDDLEILTNEKLEPLYWSLEWVLKPAFGAEAAQQMYDAALAERNREEKERAQRRQEERRRQYEALKSEFGD